MKHSRFISLLLLCLIFYFKELNGQQTLDWVVIPSGDFTFGSTNETRNINYDYAIMKYPVTLEQYAIFLNDALAVDSIYVENNAVKGYFKGDSRFPKGDYGYYALTGNTGGFHIGKILWDGTTFTADAEYSDHPVVFVTYFGAYGFADFYNLELPSFEEWEKSARGTSIDPFPWGDAIDGSYANYYNSGDTYDNGTTPVGYYDGSSHNGFQTSDHGSFYGVYDMAGNVWEWIDDPETIGSESRGQKGGSWDNGNIGHLKSAFTNYFPASNSRYNIGFRCTKIDLLYKTGDLSPLDNGPSYENIIIPENGKGYVYIDFSSDGIKVTSSNSFKIKLLDISNNVIYAHAKIIQDGILRITIDGSLFNDNSESKELKLENKIIVNDNIYTVDGSALTINAKKQKTIFNRSWDIFAGGEGGISGTAGSVGAGASVAAAKLSIKGESGMGLNLKLDENKDLTLDRRFLAGIGASLEIPGVSTGIDPPSTPISGPKASAEFMIEAIIGKAFRFSDISSLTDDEIKIAQAGFLLETFSLGELSPSPKTGSIIKGVVQTLNALGGVNDIFAKGIVKSYWGVGAEGKFGGNLGIKVGDYIDLSAANLSVSGSMQATFSKLYRDSELNKISQVPTKVGEEREIKQAAEFDIGALTFDLKLSDDVELGSGNFGVFDVGACAETSYKTILDSDDIYKKLSCQMTGGFEVNLFGDKRETFYNSIIEFPDECFNPIKIYNNGFSHMVGAINSVSFGPLQMAKDANACLKHVTDNFKNDPIKIMTEEKKGQGFDLNLGIDVSGALGIGGGVSLGINAKYYDEVTYPRKYSEVYDGGMNYLISSAEYDNVMQEDELKATLKNLLEGGFLLCKAALEELFKKVEEVVEEAKDVVINVVDQTKGKLSEVKGNITKKGKMVITYFETKKKKLKFWKYAPPEVEYTYITNSFYLIRKDENNIDRHVEIDSKLQIISHAYLLEFIPEGATVSLDSLDSPLELRITVLDEFLTNNGFSLEDKEKIKMYLFDNNLNSWIEVGGELESDTVYNSVSQLGEYALGIELTSRIDETPPQINDIGPDPNQEYSNYPIIYVAVSDEEFGSGWDYSQSYMIIENDTLNTFFDPVNSKMFYQLSEKDSIDIGEYDVYIIVSDYAGNKTTTSFSLNMNVVSVETDELSNRYYLFQNYPNPFNAQTTIRFSLPVTDDVEINIYNIQGYYIKNLFSGNLKAGKYQVNWDSSNNLGHQVASGVYFYQIKTNNYNYVRKMQLIK